ncbi:GGDEF domain-containing protein [Ralstonia pickettii]|uniref:GGDEF domain-containing protein n=1 Tax=Ralstonia pickettii TaxID=329 RepID=UPI0015FD3F7F|nr:GGDEF domain-containing protein [Ralstonia pickettii]MBX3767691.1 GGDEF domain-containing protein [Ralstonia pickettii]MBX3778972.1 GGDEF domain-containing protein [Ralstonia pickettii]MBX3806933.1 GGDEF domain-containing protein [Ralstonia pickettii]MBX3831141.1 GGDEF domain-containing protein [Ralstonia pickettii]MBX3850006.1 GGDEF domain-containing protein [Ralstonia pickettii]
MSANPPTLSHLPDARAPSRDYQARHFVPMILALSKCGVLGYAFAILLGWATGMLQTLTPLVAALGVMLVIVLTAQRQRHTGLWAPLALAHLLTEEVAIVLFGHQAGLAWVLPAFYLMPLATSPAWLTRRDFVIAMMLCAAGPLVAIFTASAPKADIHKAWLGLLLYQPICIAAAAVIHHYLLRAMARHFAAERSLADRANTDHLTGMLARQRFFELGGFAVERAQHHAEPLCALYLDVDHFKTINDTWGHAAGDEALVALSEALARVLRPKDLFGRLGGDEFAVLLPGCGLDDTLAVVDRIKAAVAASESPVGPLTISVGAAPLRRGQDLARLLADADVGLMEAKRQGRNRVCVPSDLLHSPELAQ